MQGGYAEGSVLVTGATGFIGRHLVAALLEQRARVRVLLRAGALLPPAWADHVEVRRGDLETPRSLLGACQGIDSVFHAAGFAHAWADKASLVAELHWRVNAEGTRHLAEAAAEADVKRLVFLSSVKAMGEGGQRCLDEDWPAPPETPYGKAKRAAERWVVEAGQQHGMQVVNLRLAMVYGPGGKGNLERMIAGIRHGWFPPLPEVGNRRSMVHVDDVVQAVLRAAADPVANLKTYLVTDGQTYSSRQIYDLVRSALGMRAIRWAVPERFLRAAAQVGDRLGGVLGNSSRLNGEALDKLLGWACYRSDRIQRELGYRPCRTLADSLPEIVQAIPGMGG